MFLRKLSWAQLTKGGVPLFFVLRPAAGGLTPPNIGDPYPAPDPASKVELMNARRLYERRLIGTHDQLEVAIQKSAAHPAAAEKKPVKRKEKVHGQG